MTISGGFGQAIKHFRQLGFRQWWQSIYYRADATPGRLVGTDQNGNRYFESFDALPYRHRWVLYKQHDYDASMVPPEWHSWHNGIRELPPNTDPDMLEAVKAWQPEKHSQNLSGTRARFATYSTTAPKTVAWDPHVAQRESAPSKSSL